MTSSGDRIDYDTLQQEALRGVVRAALKIVASDGLPGDHELQITFKTNAPGVSGPADVFARYPDEMMVSFRPQQYRDLAPGETFFSVTLSFGGQPRSLSVPYAAITQFVDPAAAYRLQFSVPDPPPLQLAPPVAAPTSAKPSGSG
ncbi:MAG TPA: ClpXP protease specificity-enhancing factor SspB, partial [Caulobacteraceae bacterium]|nr:ClpXP protease specificity-enhancing factor SspB [Caulobacteraceae bacterium]